MEQTKKAQNVKVIKNSEKPETPEVLADSIIRISEGFKSLVSQGLSRRAIVVLIQGMPGVSLSRHDIEVVLDNLPKLASYYIFKK